MRLSTYQKKVIDKRRKQALSLYKKGYSYAKIGAIFGKSHEWARQAVLSTEIELLKVAKKN